VAGIERRRPLLAALALAVLVGTAGCGLSQPHATPAHHAANPRSELTPDTGKAPTPTTAPPARTRQQRAPRAIARRAQPAAIAIPAIGVSAPVVRLGLTSDGRLMAPESWSAAGWWAGGPKPGEHGPAVIAGHVDSKTGPAVFFRLPELRRGDHVIITDSDRSTVRFAVERIERHPKDGFPTASVYGATRGPTLRLITCGGTFDRSSGHYRDNIIVFASIASP
jgi:sortase (surface protein transpeptidase)